MPGDEQAKSAYFQLATNFFHKYSWVYDFKATKILSEGVMRSIPNHFQEYFESLPENSESFHEILELKNHSTWPVGISKFIEDCSQLKNLSEKLLASSTAIKLTPTTTFNSTLLSGLKLPKKWNAKKYFEVVHVGNFVGEKCLLESCSPVIDIGSGLGYLSRHIATQYKIPVIGIESDSSRVTSATKEVLTSNPGLSSAAHQSYVCLKITENISEEIGPLIENHDNFCITALHACGDLSPWSLKYFISSHTCKMLAVVPCCYHKMSIDTANFPMSNSLRSVLSNYEDIKFLKNQWLWRLASQRSGDKFLSDIDKETKNLFFRAIVERVCDNENLSLRRRKRNLSDSIYKTFDEYLESAFGEKGRFDLYKEDSKLNQLDLATVNKLMLLQHETLNSWSRVITGILALQGAMQKVAEDVILIDRLGYLDESKMLKESGLIRVIPDDVSPRGMVLFGIKK